jgi:golgi pH regulator
MMDVIELEKQYQKTLELIKSNQKKLENFDKLEEQKNQNFFTSFFRTKHKNEKEMELLQDQLLILENVSQDIFFELKEAKEDEKYLKFSSTTFGKLWKLFAYFFSGYCIYKIFMSLINIIFRREVSKIDPVERFIQFISLFILKEEIDVKYWSHQINFILTTFLILSSMRSLLLNLHKVSEQSN